MLINKIRPNKEELINNHAKWQLENLKDLLTDDIIDKISHMPIPVNNIDAK